MNEHCAANPTPYNVPTIGPKVVAVAKYYLCQSQHPDPDLVVTRRGLEGWDQTPSIHHLPLGFVVVVVVVNCEHLSSSILWG